MLYLKEASIEDFEFYYSLKSEKSAVYWSGFPNKPDYNNLNDFWHKLLENKQNNRKIFILFEDSLPLGYIQTIEDDTGIELAMGIVEAARGKGYGAAVINLAVQRCGVGKTLFSYVREDNIASIKSFEKNKFIATENFYNQNFELDARSFKMIRFERAMPNMIAIIPARSGSKGLKDKNIRLLAGKPLIAHSIQAVLDSCLFDTVHVSTDSKKYADIAKTYGADVPFLRGELNASDTASSWDVVREVLNKYTKIGKHFDYCMLLQPTSPLRTAKDIVSAYELFKNKSASSVVSVTEVDHPVQWCFTMDNDFSMKNLATSPYKDTRRQDLEKHYRENGAIYIVSTENILKPDFDFYNDGCYAYVMDSDRSVDIDTLRDFIVAEALMTQTED